MRFLVAALILAGVGVRQGEITPERAPALTDQAQVRLLGRVAAVRPGGRLLRLQVGGMNFTVDAKGQTSLRPVRVGERVLVSGELLSGGRVRLRSLTPITARADEAEAVGMLISVDLPGRGLVVRTDTGRRLRVPYGRETTFVRLGRRSKAEALRFGDRLWMERPANGSVTRVEVIGKEGRRFLETGRITAVDPVRDQILVRFEGRTRTVLAGRAAVRHLGKAASLEALRTGERVRVQGSERRGVIAARRIESVP
jgi:hypothetical protein